MMRRRKSAQGGVAVEMAIVLPILILLIVGLVFFARVFWYYSVIQKAAQDAARFVSTAAQADLRVSTGSAEAPVATLARQIVEEEVGYLRPFVQVMYVDVQCDFMTCGAAVPQTVRVAITLRMTDDIFGGIGSAFYGEGGLILKSDVTRRYSAK